MVRRVHETAVGGGKGRALFTALLVSTALGAGSFASHREAFAQAQAQTRFSIPSGSLGNALTAFGRQAGLQVTYLASAAAGKTSPGFSGSGTRQQALARILAGSGLTYSFPNATTVAISAPAAGAANLPADGATTLDTITVTGRGESATGPVRGIVAHRSATGTKTDTALIDVPSSVSVITADETAKRGAKSMDGVLGYTAGVNTNLYGADKRYDFVAIRGFVQTGTGTYRDGLQTRIDNFTGARGEPYGLERVEVLKGATSTLYGLNSAGGVVNTVTKRPRDEKFGEVYTTFGRKHAETGVDFGGPVDSEGDWSYRLTGKWQNGIDGHDWANDDRLYIAPALTWKPTDVTSLTLLMDYNKRKGANRYGIPLGSGVDPETWYGEKQFDRNDTIERNIGYVFDHDFGGGLKFNSTARFSNITLSNKNTFARSDQPLTHAWGRIAMEVEGELDRFNIDNHIQYDASFGRFDSTTLFGVDYSRTSSAESDYRNYIPGVGSLTNPVYCSPNCGTMSAALYSPPYEGTGKQRTVGIYAQEQLTFDDRWILTLGGRYDRAKSDSEATFHLFGGHYPDRQEINDGALTTRAGLTFKATDELSLYATYSESFAPVAPVPSFYGSFGLPSLNGSAKPIEGVLYEAGVKYQPDSLNALLTAAIFDLNQKNVPYYVGLQRMQLGELHTRGLELEGKAEIAERMNVTFAYSLLDTEIMEDGLPAVISDRGHQMQFVPRQSASAWVDYTFEGNGVLGDLTLGLGARYVGSRYADTKNTVKIDPYVVFDAALNYKVTEHASLSVNATNLFDKEYVSHVETWSAPDTLFYGDRRSIKATLKYTW